MVGVLLLHRTLPAASVIAGMQAAVLTGHYEPDLVAVEARRWSPTAAAAVVVLPASAPAVAHHTRPAPSLHAYDALLSGVSA